MGWLPLDFRVFEQIGPALKEVVVYRHNRAMTPLTILDESPNTTDFDAEAGIALHGIKPSPPKFHIGLRVFLEDTSFITGYIGS
jgi:hypothetical protein